MIHAAGIIFITEDRKILLLRRSKEGDHAGEWAFPGGKIEDNETPEDAARRECREEIAANYEGRLIPWTRRIADGVDFTTYQAHVQPFDVKLNEEHDKAGWFHLKEALDLPLHPGAQVAIKRFHMSELDVARCIRDGELTSPQQFANIWLFALRITGTGKSFRPQLKEHVWRDSSYYLTPEFLERCNGVAIVWDHPPVKDEQDHKGGAILDTKEFRKRTVGTTFLPYIKEAEAEVWAIGKIYDDEAAHRLQQELFSTSPTILFGDEDKGHTYRMSDGEHLLIEGRPTFVESLAVGIAQGIWDKGGPPDGMELVAAADSLSVDNPLEEALALLRETEIDLLASRITAR